jgi:tetratricopeptide (TPR) repeat protein
MKLIPLILILAACGPKAEPPAAVVPAAAPASVPTPATAVADPAASAWGEVETAPLAPPPPSEEELQAQADKQLQDAAGLLTTSRQADAERAVTLLKGIARDYPENALAFYNLGLAYQILGQDSTARKAYLRASDIHPSLGDAWLNLGAMRRNQGDNKRAIQYYRAGLRGDSENMRLRSALVGVLRELGQFDQALEEAKKALVVNANSLEIYNDLGLIYLAQAKSGVDVPTKLALSQFYLERAKRKEGGDQHARVQCNLARVYEMKGLIFLATKTYQKAMEMDPEMVQCSLYLTAIYLDSRNHADAIPLLERASGLEPENAAILLNLGIAYRGAKRYEEAKRQYTRVLELQPENPEPYLNLAILAGDYVKAFDEAVTLYETYRDSGGAYASLVDGYVAATLKEKKRIEREERRQRKNEERERARQERQRKLEEAEGAKELERLRQLQAPVTPEPEPTTPGEDSAPEPAPEAPTEESPW